MMENFLKILFMEKDNFILRVLKKRNNFKLLSKIYRFVQKWKKIRRVLYYIWRQNKVKFKIIIKDRKSIMKMIIRLMNLKISSQALLNLKNDHNFYISNFIKYNLNLKWKLNNIHLCQIE